MCINNNFNACQICDLTHYSLVQYCKKLHVHTQVQPGLNNNESLNVVNAKVIHWLLHETIRVN